MCGLTGFWGFGRRFEHEQLRRIGAAMASTLDHRGPDGQSTWIDGQAQLVFGHTRLSIIERTELGDQPMISRSGKCVITYNGEVYNAAELRAALAERGVVFRGRSDTEVVLEACEEWGVADAVTRMNGMFAFAFWDRRARRLTLVRDRIGIKPLFWGWSGDQLFFGSQPKSFGPHPDWRPEIDREALALYLRFNYVPTPFSIYKGIRKLMPGTLVEIDDAGETTETRYWDTAEVAQDGQAQPDDGADGDLIDALDSVLADAVESCRIADVPVGVLLSGGVDSSTVAALMQRTASERVEAFTIGFQEEWRDESRYAAAVAEHLGLKHHVLQLSAADAAAIIPRLPTYYDEPFADSSAIPSFAVAELARARLPVCLSGEGGDELFGGYARYGNWQVDGSLDFSGVETDDRVYRSRVSHWEDPVPVVAGFGDSKITPWTPDFAPRLRTDLERRQCIDMCSYLPDDLLTKMDRAGMAHGLEIRIPYLDCRLIEFVSRQSRRMKVRDGVQKWLLRQVTYRYLPRSLIDRDKMGFSIPAAEWLRGPLLEWAESLLNEDALGEGGLLDPEPIRRRWYEHLTGHSDHSQSLWGVLSFQAWRQAWLPR
jgi:asparagine synthase (glutamine-hydrolysing)